MRTKLICILLLIAGVSGGCNSVYEEAFFCRKGVLTEEEEEEEEEEETTPPETLTPDMEDEPPTLQEEESLHTPTFPADYDKALKFIAV